MALKNRFGFNIYEIIILIFLLIFISCIILLSSVPPVSRDALTHHLAVPKIYLKYGLLREIPSLEFSYYPMNLDLLYLIPLSMGNDIFPKYIHFSFALLTAWLIYWHIKCRINKLYGLLGAFFFLTIPIIIKLSITVYVDLGLVFFSTFSLLFLIKWMESSIYYKKYLFLSAVSCGMALGTKYNGLILIFILPLFAAFIFSRNSKENLQKKNFNAIYIALFYLSITLIVFSPWMIRNYYWTNNPIYPLYDKVFTGLDAVSVQPSESDQINHFIIRNNIYNESIFDILFIPIRIFFQGRDDNPKYFDGVLNPLLFVLPFFSFIKINNSHSSANEKKLLITFSIVYLLFVYLLRDMRIRYIAPIIPPLVILSVYGFRNIQHILYVNNSKYEKLQRISLIIFWILIFILTAFNIRYLSSQFRVVQPISYLTGEVSREEYISKHWAEYPVIKFVNENLPEDAIIYAYFLGNRSYYSDRAFLFDEFEVWNALVSSNSDTALIQLKVKGVKYFLVRYDLFNKWINDNYDEKQLVKLRDFFHHHSSLLVETNGYGLYHVSYE